MCVDLSRMASVTTHRLNGVIVSVCFSLAFSSHLAYGQDVTWTGCGITKKAFMSEIAKTYEQQFGVATKISGGGATKGIRAVSAGSSQLGGTCRHWLGGTTEKHDQEKNAQLVPVAWDAIVAIVNPDNPVDSISMADLKAIYDGKITNWKQLGGNDKRIVLVTRQGKSSGVGYMFRHLVFDDPEYTFKARSLKVKSSGPLEKKIEKSASAFGVTGISSAKKRNVKLLSLDDTEPSKEMIGSGKYPLFRPLYLATGSDMTPESEKVLNYVLSPEGQEIISNQGTVNLREGAEAQKIWDQRKQAYGL